MFQSLYLLDQDLTYLHKQYIDVLINIEEYLMNHKYMHVLILNILPKNQNKRGNQKFNKEINKGNQINMLVTLSSQEK